MSPMISRTRHLELLGRQRLQRPDNAQCPRGFEFNRRLSGAPQVGDLVEPRKRGQRAGTMNLCRPLTASRVPGEAVPRKAACRPWAG